MQYVGVSTKETDLFDCHSHRKSRTNYKVVWYHTYLHPKLALFVEQTQIAKIKDSIKRAIDMHALESISVLFIRMIPLDDNLLYMQVQNCWRTDS